MSDWHCSGGQLCCNSKCKNKTNHLGCSCGTQGHCSAGESCCSFTCVKEYHNCLGWKCTTVEECYYAERCCNGVCSVQPSSLGCYCDLAYRVCYTGQSCCGNTCVLNSSCVGFTCTNDGECLDGEYCCSDKCVKGKDCLGQKCNNDSDCGLNEQCCDGKCRYRVCFEETCFEKCDFCITDSDCTDVSNINSNKKYCCKGECTNDRHCFTTRKKAVNVFSSTFASLFMVFAIVLTFFMYRRRKKGSHHETDLQQIRETTINEAQESQLFPLLPPYRQGAHLQHGCEQLGRDITTSYDTPTIEEEEPPLPYSFKPGRDSAEVQTIRT